VVAGHGRTPYRVLVVVVGVRLDGARLDDGVGTGGPVAGGIVEVVGSDLSVDLGEWLGGAGLVLGVGMGSRGVDEVGARGQEEGGAGDDDSLALGTGSSMAAVARRPARHGWRGEVRDDWAITSRRDRSGAAGESRVRRVAAFALV